MADEPVVVSEDPASIRRRLREWSLRTIRLLVQQANGRAAEGYREVLDEMQRLYRYDLWDLLVVLTFTLELHPKTGLPAVGHRRAAKDEERRKKALRELGRWHERYMMDEGALFAALEAREFSRPRDSLLRTRGRPAAWILTEFAGHLGVILVETRWQQARPENPDADPHDFVWSYGKDLLERAGGILVRPEWLQHRYWALKRKGDIPQAPNDGDPAAWFQAIFPRLDARLSASERRILLAPSGQEDEVRRAFRFYAFRPGLVVTEVPILPGHPEHPRSVLPAPKKPAKKKPSK